MFRSPVLPEIQTLDAVRDHQRIVFLCCRVDFPWDTTRAWAVRILPRRKRPVLRTEMTQRSYPSGYQMEKVGPSEVERSSG